MNQITIHFQECEPAPSKGYKVQWRVLGSGDPYTDAGNFFTSPAVFTDPDNPPGTIYEGTITAEGTNTICNPVPWQTTEESPGGSSGFDNSSCGTSISVNTGSSGYVPLGPYTLHVDVASQVTLAYDVLGRPNRFTLYDNGAFAQTSGWKGIAPYAGPWGMSLNTPLTGSIVFIPILGHTYTLLVEVGPAGPPPYDISDNFLVDIICTP